MRRRNVALSVGLLLVVLLSSVLLVEVVLRVYANVAATSLSRVLRIDPYGVLVEPHGDLGFRPRPQSTFEYANGTAANTNAMGFRGPEVAVPKPAGTFRVILLGGSTTFGWGVNDGETIARYMSGQLAEMYPQRAFEVVNLAFDGYDSYQLLERLRSDGVRLEPDAVIVNSGVNDVQNSWFRDIEDGDPRTLLYRATMEQARFEQARGGPTTWTRLKHWFYLARLPGWVRGQMRLAATRNVSIGAGPRPFHWDALDYFERNLKRLLDLASESGARVVLFSTPPSSLLTLYGPDEPPRASYWIRDAQTTQMYRDSLSVRMQEMVAKEAARGSSVALVSHDVLLPTLFLDDAHLTPEGNRRVAEDFSSALGPWLVRAAGDGER